MPGHTELFWQNKAVIPTSPYQPVQFRGVGDFETCVNNLKLLLNISGSCSGSSCAPLAPPIDWDRTELYGFSEFYYTMEDIFRIAGKYSYSKFVKYAKVILCFSFLFEYLYISDSDSWFSSNIHPCNEEVFLQLCV